MVKVTKLPKSPKIVATLDLSGQEPVVRPVAAKVESQPSSRPRSRKKYSFPRRSDFAKSIGYLERDRAESLDQLRDDLQEAIERVVRVHGAFTKKLNESAVQSNRIKHIVSAIGEVPFHCDLQRKIVGKTITSILESKVVNEKRAQQEAEEEERQRKKQNHCDDEWCSCNIFN